VKEYNTQKCKDYRDKNRDLKNIKAKEYRETKGVIINEKSKIKIKCECGCEVVTPLLKKEKIIKK